jgi:hypothetical protein
MIAELDEGDIPTEKIQESVSIMGQVSIAAGIPRWRLEVGSRKRPSYSEILERCCRHTLQA